VLAKIYAEGGIRNETDLILCDSLGRDAYNYQTVVKISSNLTDSSPSHIMTKIRSFDGDLKQNFSLSQIDRFIGSAKIFNQGENFIDHLKIDFPNGKAVYFSLNTDTPTQIISIWLNNGDLLEGKFSDNNPEKLLFPGTINDPDGYVNIREKPETDAKITARFLNDDYFFYVPCNDCSWLLVKRRWNANFIGYVHKSRIKNYIEFPMKLKQMVRKELNE